MLTTGLTSAQLRMIRTAVQEHHRRELEHRSCEDPDGYLYKLDGIRHAIGDALGERALHEQHYDDRGFKQVRVRQLEQMLGRLPDSEDNPLRLLADAIWFPKRPARTAAAR